MPRAKLNSSKLESVDCRFFLMLDVGSITGRGEGVYGSSPSLDIRRLCSCRRMNFPRFFINGDRPLGSSVGIGLELGSALSGD